MLFLHIHNCYLVICSLFSTHCLIVKKTPFLFQLPARSITPIPPADFSPLAANGTTPDPNNGTQVMWCCLQSNYLFKEDHTHKHLNTIISMFLFTPPNEVYFALVLQCTKCFLQATILLAQSMLSTLAATVLSLNDQQCS